MSLEPPDMELETRGVEALLHVEKTKTDHSSAIVDLLQKAIAQFRTFRSPRSESHLTVTMAEELKDSKKYKEALDLLEPVMQHYRSEKWRTLLDAVLSLGMKCAFLQAEDTATYIKLALDLSAKESSVNAQEKSRIMENVAGLFQGRVPSTEPGKLLPRCRSPYVEIQRLSSCRRGQRFRTALLNVVVTVLPRLPLRVCTHYKERGCSQSFGLRMYTSPPTSLFGPPAGWGTPSDVVPATGWLIPRVDPVIV